MNDRIIVIDGVTQSHKDGRRIRDVSIQNTMTICYRGSKALHEMRGRENFEMEEMLDVCGNSVSTGKIETVSVWHKDGLNEFHVNLSREDFWFQNGAICEGFCEDKGINPKF